MSNDQKGLVSVIVPAFNREKYIAEAIDSVLSQDYMPLELIVVDDGSTDKTAEIISSYSGWLTAVQQANGGIAAARNAGIGQATGEFMAFLDSDDIWIADKLSRQMACFKADPSLDAVFGYVEQFISPELDEAYARTIKIPRKVMPAQLSSAMLVRRSVFDQVGLYNSKLKAGIDIDWYARMRDMGFNERMLTDVVYRRRIHPANNTAAAENANLQRLRVVKAALDRRRGMAVASSK